MYIKYEVMELMMMHARYIESSVKSIVQVQEQAAMRRERAAMAQLMDQLLEKQQQSASSTIPSTAIDDSIRRLNEEQRQLQQTAVHQVADACDFVTCDM